MIEIPDFGTIPLVHTPNWSFSDILRRELASTCAEKLLDGARVDEGHGDPKTSASSATFTFLRFSRIFVFLLFPCRAKLCLVFGRRTFFCCREIARVKHPRCRMMLFSDSKTPTTATFKGLVQISLRTDFWDRKFSIGGGSAFVGEGPTAVE